MRVVASIEVEVEQAFLDLLSPGEVVFDVGANIGWFSLLAARRVNPAGHVVAFEPSLENAACVQRNAVSNGLGNVTVIPAAVSDRDGWVSFDANSSLKGKLSDEGQAIVPAVSLDSWLDGREPPSVVKIDVEGAEIQVLRGMAGILKSVKPTLIIELHGTNGHVADLLDQAGYTHRPIDHPATTRDAPWWVHILASPGS